MAACDASAHHDLLASLRSPQAAGNLGNGPARQSGEGRAAARHKPHLPGLDLNFREPHETSGTPGLLVTTTSEEYEA